MSNAQSISTNKIIFFVVFFCAAIITSLFIFHSRHKPAHQEFANEYATLLPVAREIKPFELVASNSQKFTEKDFYHHWTLLFFGFTHCSTICPTTLDLMNRSYEKLHSAYPDLQVVLISIDPERDTPDALAKYTRSFNPDFIGVSGKIQELRKLQSQLGIYSVRDASSGANYQIQHTSSIMLINPQGKWAGLFKYGLNPQQLTQAFTDSMQYLAKQQG